MNTLLLLLALNSPISAAPGLEKAPPCPSTLRADGTQPDGGQKKKKKKKNGEESEEERSA